MFKFLLIILPLIVLSNNIWSQSSKTRRKPITKSFSNSSNEISNELVVSKAEKLKSKGLNPKKAKELYFELKRLNAEIKKYQVDLRSIDKFIIVNMAYPFVTAEELFHMKPEGFNQIAGKYYESIIAIRNHTDKLCIEASKK